MCQRPLPELLARFFAFYAESFAWGSEVVSIRTGRWEATALACFRRGDSGRRTRSMHISLEST